MVSTCMQGRGRRLLEVRLATHLAQGCWLVPLLVLVGEFDEDLWRERRKGCLNDVGSLTRWWQSLGVQPQKRVVGRWRAEEFK